MNKKIIVFDFETTSIDPRIADPIQIAATVIDPYKLQIIEDSQFYSWCCPENIDAPTYIKNNLNTLQFHCKNYNISMDELIKRIKEAPSEKLIFEKFIEYIKKYHNTQGAQSIFTAPILSGFNVFNYDFIIFDRLCSKYKYLDKNNKQNIYSERDSMDIMKIAILWLNYIPDIRSYSMDSLRKYFNMDTGQAHDALFDVKQEAQILLKFLTLHKSLAKNIVFKNCFAKKEQEYAS